MPPTLRSQLFVLFAILGSAACMLPMHPEEESPPVAVISTSAGASVGLPVRLDGRDSSDPNDEAITWEWTLTPPAGSGSEMTGPTTSVPTFTPDVEGEYGVSLTVTNASGLEHTTTTIVLATNRSTTSTIDDTGGEIEAEGRLRLVIPPGALSTPTTITITIAAPSQFPEAFEGGEIVDLEFFDLQPEGLDFALPVTAEIDLPGAYDTNPPSAAGGSMLYVQDAIRPGALTANMGPRLDAPTTGTLSTEVTRLEPIAVLGGLAERARDLLVTSSPVPSLVSVGETFEVELAAILDYSTLSEAELAYMPDFFMEGAIAFDGSTAPVETAPSTGGAGDFVLSPDGGGFTGTIPYHCASTGSGTWSVVVEVEESLADSPGSTFRSVRLSAPVECVEPTEVSERLVPRATWISPGFGPNEVIVAGTSPHRWDVVTGEVTSLDADAIFGASAAHHVMPIGDALFVNAVDGKNWIWEEATAWRLAPPPTTHHAQHFVQGDDGRLYGASGLAAPAIVDSDFSTTVHAYDHIQAYWGDGDLGVMLQAQGDGNSAFSPTAPILADVAADGPVTVLTGDALGVVLDAYQRLNRDFDCFGPTQGLSNPVCIFAGGETDPGHLVDGQPARDGQLSIFSIDVVAGTTTALEEERTPVVGAVAFVQGGRTLFAFADQLRETIEFREVSSSGITWSHSVQIGTSCLQLYDLTITPSGNHAVASCFGGDGQGLEGDRYVWVDVPPGA